VPAVLTADAARLVRLALLSAAKDAAHAADKNAMSHVPANRKLAASERKQAQQYRALALEMDAALRGEQTLVGEALIQARAEQAQDAKLEADSRRR
jgi:hypothetical protein